MTAERSPETGVGHHVPVAKDLIDELEVGFATTPDGSRLAYGLLGAGPRHILMFGSGLLSFEASIESPLAGWWWPTLTSLGSVIAMDLRGVGRSDPLPPDFTGENQVREAVTILDAVGVDRVNAIGIGNGGGCALLFAATFPERIESIIVCDSWARYRSDIDYSCGMDGVDEERAMAVAQRWGTGEYLEVVGQHGGTGSSQNPLNLKAAARLERMSNTAAAHVRLLSLYHELDLREHLPSIDAPVLVLERPGLLPGLAGSGEDLASRLTNATYVDIGSDFRSSDRDTGPREVTKFLTGAARDPTQRVLTAVLITDLVGSTEKATRMGDGAWRHLLGEHDRIVEDMVSAAGGRVVNSTGDGVVAVAPGPTQALRCAERIGRALSLVDLPVRCGVHVGEVELRGDDIGGVAVHVTARVAALAQAGEILVTESVALAAVGSGVKFEPAGTHVLKGLPDRWTLLRLCTKQG